MPGMDEGAAHSKTAHECVLYWEGYGTKTDTAAASLGTLVCHSDCERSWELEWQINHDCSEPVNEV